MRPSFETLLAGMRAEEAHVDLCWRPTLHARVKVRGTGRWAGMLYRAEVVDVRRSDDTVKVKFDDGGFKRFPAASFAVDVQTAMTPDERKAAEQEAAVAAAKAGGPASVAEAASVAASSTAAGEKVWHSNALDCARSHCSSNCSGRTCPRVYSAARLVRFATT